MGKHGASVALRSTLTNGLRLAGLVGVILIAAGCALSIQTAADVQPGVDLSQYRSFRFDETDQRLSGDPRVDANPYFEARLHLAIQWELENRGIDLNGEGRALAVHHHVNVHDMELVHETDQRAGYQSGHEEEAQTVVYEEATFLVGIADAETRQIVWRGWATLGAGPRLEDPERMRRRVDEALAKMFERFPVSRARRTATDLSARPAGRPPDQLTHLP